MKKGKQKKVHKLISLILTATLFLSQSAYATEGAIEFVNSDTFSEAVETVSDTIGEIGDEIAETVSELLPLDEDAQEEEEDLEIEESAEATTAETQAATASAQEGSTEFIYTNYLNNPFGMITSGQESINGAMGTLSYARTDISLPGRNGLDVALPVVYDQNATEDKHIKITPVYGYDEDNKYGVIRLDSEEDALYVDEKYTIGRGWYFDLPYIQYDPRNKVVNDGTVMYEDDNKIYTGGIAYSFEEDTNEITNTVTEEVVEHMTLSLVNEDQNYTNGLNVSATRVLTHRDGREDYFDAQGNLIATKDRFENCIEYQYAGYRKLSKIVDTLGRGINFEYIPTAETASTENPVIAEIKVTMPGQRIVRYIRTGDAITSIQDFEGRTTTFEYAEQMGFHTVYRWDMLSYTQHTLYYLLLTKITYPGGGSTHYDYTKSIKKTCFKKEIYAGAPPTGSLNPPIINPPATNMLIIDCEESLFGPDQEFYRVSARYDSENGTQYNRKTYQNGNSHYTYVGGWNSIIVTDDNSSIRYDYNMNGMEIKQEILVDGASKQKIETEYTDNLYPKTLTTYYDGSTTSAKTVEWQYNQYGELESYIDELGNEWQYSGYLYGTPQEIRQIDTEMDVLTVTYNTFDTEDYEIENPYGNVIRTEVMYKDYSDDTYSNWFWPDQYIQVTEYEYGDPQHPGNMTKKSVWLDDEGEEKAVEHYEYSDDYENAYLTRKYTDVTSFPETGWGNTTATQRIEERYTYDLATGLPTITQDTAGNKTRQAYDKLGRVTGVWHTPAGGQEQQMIAMQYDDTNHIVTATATENNFQIKEYYDPLGRFIRKDEKQENGTWLTTQKTSYDSLSRVKIAEDAEGNLTETSYDFFNRPILTKYGTRNSNGTIAYEPYTSSIEYNTSGTWVRTTDPEGNFAEEFFDLAGRSLGTRVYPDKDNAQLYYDTDYEYYYSTDMVRTATVQVDANTTEVTEYVYDTLGQVQQVIDANGDITRYTYDKVGNVTKVTKESDDEIRTLSETEYDELGRPLVVTDAMGQSVRYKYLPTQTRVLDRNGVETVTDFDSRGRQTSITAGDSVITYQYLDAQNKQLITTNGQTQTYEMYQNGNLKKVQMPDGKTMEYQDYDGNNNVTRIKDYANNIVTYQYSKNRLDKIIQGTTETDSNTTSYTYYDNGMLKTVTNPGNIKSEYTYTGMGLLEELEVTEGTDLIARYEYTYNGVGNQLSKTETVGTTTKTHAYTYDALNRIHTVTDPENTVTQYYYDLGGNIQRVTNTANNVLTSETLYEYDLNNRLTKRTNREEGIDNISEFWYDNNGNLISELQSRISTPVTPESLSVGLLGENDETDALNTRLYGYDAFNRLTSYQDTQGITASYTYMPDGMRQSKTVNGIETKFYYQGQYIVNESQNGVITATNLVGLTGIIARDSTANAETGYFIRDGHGDVVKVHDDTGTILADYTFDIWGNEQESTGNFENPFGYTGEYTDAESGLIYLRARYYDASIGRFISEDPHWNSSNMIYGDEKSEEEQEDQENKIKIPDMNAIVQSSNLYTYCMNNPVYYVDLSGESVSAYGVSGSIAAILGYEGQVLWVTDDKGNFALVTVNGAINSIGIALSGVVMSFPDMPTVYEMEGLGFSVSASAGNGSASILFSGDYEGVAYQYGIGGEVDYWIGADGTYSHIVLSGNIYEIANWLKNLLNMILPDQLKIN